MIVHVLLAWSEKNGGSNSEALSRSSRRGERCFPGGRRYFDCQTIEAFTPEDGRADGVSGGGENLSAERGGRLVRWMDLARGAVRDPLARECRPPASSAIDSLVGLATMRLANAALVVQMPAAANAGGTSARLARGRRWRP